MEHLSEQRQRELLIQKISTLTAEEAYRYAKQYANKLTEEKRAPNKDEKELMFKLVRHACSSAEPGDPARSHMDYDLARFYENGVGVREDDSEAYKFYLQAHDAKPSCLEATLRLARAYERGELGCREDDKKAEMYFNIIGGVERDKFNERRLKKVCAGAYSRYREEKFSDEDEAKVVNAYWKINWGAVGACLGDKPLKWLSSEELVVIAYAHRQSFMRSKYLKDFDTAMACYQVLLERPTHRLFEDIFELGLSAYKAKSHTRAAKCFELLAGKVEAKQAHYNKVQFYYGYYLETGKGEIKQNVVEAAKCYERSSRWYGYERLASLHEKGFGDNPSNLEVAKSLLERALKDIDEIPREKYVRDQKLQDAEKKIRVSLAKIVSKISLLQAAAEPAPQSPPAAVAVPSVQGAVVVAAGSEVGGAPSNAEGAASPLSQLPIQRVAEVSVSPEKDNKSSESSPLLPRQQPSQPQQSNNLWLFALATVLVVPILFYGMYKLYKCCFPGRDEDNEPSTDSSKIGSGSYGAFSPGEEQSDSGHKSPPAPPSQGKLAAQQFQERRNAEGELDPSGGLAQNEGQVVSALTQ